MKNLKVERLGTGDYRIRRSDLGGGVAVQKQIRGKWFVELRDGQRIAQSRSKEALLKIISDWDENSWKQARRS